MKKALKRCWFMILFFFNFWFFFPLSLLYICWHIMNFYASYLYIHLCFAYNSMGFFLMENKEQKGKKLWNMATNKRIGKKLFHWHYEKKIIILCGWKLCCRFLLDFMSHCMIYVKIDKRKLGTFSANFPFILIFSQSRGLKVFLLHLNN